MVEQVELGKLYEQLLAEGAEPHKHHGYEVLDGNGLEILVDGGKFVSLVWLSRHKTPKDLVKIEVKAKTGVKSVIVTTDHICMVYNRDHFFEQTCAKDVLVGSTVSVYDMPSRTELVGEVVAVKNKGKTDEWVYDCEVDSDMHAFYANDILVHNSQFLNLQCVSAWLAEKYGLDKSVAKWPKKYKREMWNIMSKFIDDEVNTFVRNAVHDYCHTTQQNVLTYELEYMTDSAIFEGKKHYAVHQCIVEGNDVDKTKYAGIELKKNQVPKEMKEFLSEIYSNTLLKDWSDKEYVDYVNDLYDKFKSFSIDEVSFWKGYNTERQAVGFLQMQNGTTGIAKACTYYNQIIKKLGLGKKYEEIRVGDKVRFCYIKESNRYGINCIAYKPGSWPKEFDHLFAVDYKVMFKKIILDPLKRFREACHFSDTDPSKQAVQDIFAL